MVHHRAGTRRTQARDIQGVLRVRHRVPEPMGSQRRRAKSGVPPDGEPGRPGRVVGEQGTRRHGVRALPPGPHAACTARRRAGLRGERRRQRQNRRHQVGAGEAGAAQGFIRAGSGRKQG